MRQLIVSSGSHHGMRRSGGCRLTVTLWALVVATVALVGCRNDPQQDGATSQAKKTYTVTGIVKSVDLKLGEVTIAHDDIPGFMEAMTMPFPVADAAELKSLKPGDQVRASLVPANPFYRLEDIVIEKRPEGEGDQAKAASPLTLTPSPGP